MRESACTALGDVVRGRRWKELDGRLQAMWELLFRVNDDVKESVSYNYLFVF